MPTEPYGWTIFCDDIRAEIGGKFSYMGVYGGTMNIHAKTFPATLPRLALSIRYRIALDDLRLENVNIKVLLPGDEEGKPTVDAEIPITEVIANMDPPTLPGDAFREFVTNIILAPVTIKEKGRLRVRATGGAGTINLGTLHIDLQPAKAEQGGAT
jgi:hypothetical protein